METHDGPRLVARRRWAPQAEFNDLAAGDTVNRCAGGFWLKAPDDSYKLHLDGYVQGVSRFYASQEPAGAPSAFTMRRVRPIFEGTVAKYFDFRIMPDFGGGGATLYDAWGNIHFWD